MSILTGNTPRGASPAICITSSYRYWLTRTTDERRTSALKRFAKSPSERPATLTSQALPILSADSSGGPCLFSHQYNADTRGTLTTASQQNIAVPSATTLTSIPGVYDAPHRDYHRWDAREDRAYLAERHREYREFRTLDSREQEEYWQWRHEHPDRDRR